MFKIEEMPSQAGRIAIVTGANIGLGLATAKGLVSKGAKVIIASRNKEKALQAQEEIEKEFPTAETDIILLDLGSKKSIKSFADEFLSKYERLDILINNAGIMMPPYRETEEGFESQWGVNYLGHFYLTGLLINVLMNTKDSRIVTLSSLAHQNGQIHFDDINQEDKYKPMELYRQSKLACLIFAYELQRRLEKKGSSVTSYGAHPGVAATNLFASAPKWMKIIAPLFTWLLHSVEDGAEPTLMAAMDTSLEGGEYLGPTGKRGMKGEPGVVESNDISQDKEVGDRLWDLSEKQLGYEFEV